MSDITRVVIPRCIGCGAMRELERCEGGCDERHLELVAAADHDELAAAERAARERITALLPVIEDLAARGPAHGEWREAYLALSREARLVLHDAGPDPCWGPQPAAPDPPVIGVWRCADCGAVDAPQECLGICIWRSFEWVDAGAFESLRTQAAAVRELEHAVRGLLQRIAFSTPREGAWQRSWLALSREGHDLARRAHEVLAAEPALA